MKRLTVLCLSLLLALSLCACGGDTPAEETTDPATESATTETQPEASPEAETTPETKTEGKYACTAIAFGEDVLDGGDNWLELKSGGKATLFMEGEKFKATYTLTDGALSIQVEDLGNGSGTLTDGVITLELSNMVCTFEK